MIVSRATSGLVLLSRQVAAGAANVDFTGISSTFDEYLFVVANATASLAASLAVRVSLAGSFKAGVADYSYNLDWYFGATASDEHRESNSTLYNLGTGIDATTPMSGEMRLFSPGQASTPKAMTGFFGLAAAVPLQYRSVGLYSGGTSGTPNAAIDGIRFLPTAGTLSGTFAMYGLRR